MLADALMLLLVMLVAMGLGAEAALISDEGAYAALQHPAMAVIVLQPELLPIMLIVVKSSPGGSLLADLLHKETITIVTIVHTIVQPEVEIEVEVFLVLYVQPLLVLHHNHHFCDYLLLLLFFGFQLQVLEAMYPVNEEVHQLLQVVIPHLLLLQLLLQSEQKECSSLSHLCY